MAENQQKSSLLILGAGGFGRVVYELAETLGCYEKISFLDDGATDFRVIGKLESYQVLRREFDSAVVAIGNNALRLQWLKKLAVADYHLPVLCHPSAFVSKSAKIGDGTMILQLAVVNTAAQIGQGVILNCGSVVDHDCVVADGCHICLNSVVKSQATVPSCTKVEAGEVYDKTDS